MLLEFGGTWHPVGPEWSPVELSKSQNHECRACIVYFRHSRGWVHEGLGGVLVDVAFVCASLCPTMELSEPVITNESRTEKESFFDIGTTTRWILFVVSTVSELHAPRKMKQGVGGYLLLSFDSKWAPHFYNFGLFE